MNERDENRTDNLSEEQRKHTMRMVHGKDTKPELIVRRLVFSMGYRYKLHDASLPGKPDMVFSSRRKVIFVHGCFWHGHSCKAGLKTPKANDSYWNKKLERNRNRDILTMEKLCGMGWTVKIVWECEIHKREQLAEDLAEFLG